ncbi:MAG TPA: lipopolysaccharide transport periplasmic protein LptA [Burkholderiaceae bacterium]
MKNSRLLHRLSLLPALLALALAAGAAHAEKADRNKPMNVEADALRYDDLRQTSLFTGNVVITKGSLLIRAARVDVRQDTSGAQFGVATAGPGKLAYFRQKREGVDETIEGEGEVLEYDGKADTVKFVRNAVLRRYRGGVLADETTGDNILYDNTTDVFTVNGGRASAAPGNPGGRIRAVLSPSGTASATPAPPAVLQPSGKLGGDGK